MTDLGDNLPAVLVLAQIVLLPVLTAGAALLVRRHPARAHTVITAGLIATLVAPLLSIAASTAGFGLLPGIELTPGAPAISAVDDSRDVARTAPGIGPVMVGLIAWSLVSAALLARLAIGLRRGFRIAASATPCRDERANDILHRITARRTRRASLWHTPHLESPAIFCWCRSPRILLPVSLDLGADPRVLAQMLEHEVGHLARRDHWWRLVAEVAACVLPWHPVVWSLRRALYETSEMACDARVLRGEEEPERYAETLLRLAPCRTVQLPALHAVRSSPRIARRVRAILGPERPRDRNGTPALILVTLAAATVTAGAALAQRRPPVIAPIANGPTPQFAVEAVPREVDLGLAAPGSIATGIIRLVNVGARPVTIDAQKAACGCTTVEPVDGRVIAPGAVLEVPVTLAAPDTPDTEHRRKVTFFFQDLDPLLIHVRLRTTGS